MRDTSPKPTDQPDDQPDGHAALGLPVVDTLRHVTWRGHFDTAWGGQTGFANLDASSSHASGVAET